MKKDLHPTDYRLVVFQDTSSDFKILTRSTVASNESIKWEDGNEYPLIKVHVSSASHPFFTGEEKIMDIEGRVDKFKARTEAAKKAREAKQASAKKPEKKAKVSKSDESPVTREAKKPVQQAKDEPATKKTAEKKQVTEKPTEAANDESKTEDKK